MKTYFKPKEKALAERKWVVLNAEGQVVGRLATKIASLLRGKNDPGVAPYQDSGNFVVVVNADKVVFTGGKENKKIYYRHTNFTGGIKRDRAADLLATKPEEVIKHAVKGMLPATTLGRAQLKKLKIYKGAEHPHQAQNPEAYK